MPILLILPGGAQAGDGPPDRWDGSSFSGGAGADQPGVRDGSPVQQQEQGKEDSLVGDGSPFGR